MSADFLDDCACCEEQESRAIHTRPGQSQLAYRLGTHGTFLRRMLRRLPREAMPDGPNQGGRPLDGLSVRSPEDPAIGFLDGWSTIAHVLSFYQERIANEGFLRTASELGSVLELARSIGYELNPGVAASTHLAFTVEEAAGSPTEVLVPRGTRVLSVPGAGQLPQTFETVAEITARPEWNAIRPRSSVPQALIRGQESLYLKGVSALLQPGDALVIVGDNRASFPGSERWDFRIVQTVTTNVEGDYTLVTWDPGVGHVNPLVDPADNPRVFVFRQRAALFGFNAPDWRTMPDSTKAAFDPKFDPDNPDRRRTQWPGFEIQGDVIDLNAVFPKLLAGSWVVLTKPSYVELYRALEVDTDSRTDFSLTSQVSRIRPDTTEHLSWFALRDTVVFLQSEELALAELPLTDPVQGNVVELDAAVPPLAEGQPLVFSGKRIRARVVQAAPVELVSLDGSQRVTLATGTSCRVLEPSVTATGGITNWRLLTDSGFEGYATVGPDAFLLEPALDADESVSEVALVESTTDDLERTTVELERPLRHMYDRASLTVNANAAPATHGETVREVLGSGDGSVPNQRFALKKPPLTYVSAATTSGRESTLEVRVNDVLWQEEASLYQLGPASQSYVVRRDEKGVASVTFGDGRSGARLPPGRENVIATYRSGVGPKGQVPAGRLILLSARPLGIRSVTNSVAASGAAAPETVDNARASAPVTVLTLDRIVSTQDFEDFARAFTGIGKASATVLWDDLGTLVHLTVAGENGDEVASDSTLYKNLLAALDLARDKLQRLRVDTYEKASFGITASVVVDSRYVAETVLIDVIAALEAAFGFDSRALGQPVTAAEVMTVIQGVSGVAAVDLDQLFISGGASASGPTAVLPASLARLEGTVFRPAQLLLIDPSSISLQEMAE